MREEKDIRDDEIRVIGDLDKQQPKSNKWLLAVIIGIVAIVGVAVWWVVHSERKSMESEQIEPTYFEPQDSLQSADHSQTTHFGREVDATTPGFCEIRDTIINDIPLRLFIPHNAGMSLHVGRLNQQDTTIIYAAQAADIRRDNGKIVGAFVLNGEPLAWGLSKKGFCASIDGKVTVGVADNSPLFEEATERSGYFFRQYPLVKDGVMIENEPKINRCVVRYAIGWMRYSWLKACRRSRSTTLRRRWSIWVQNKLSILSDRVPMAGLWMNRVNATSSARTTIILDDTVCRRIQII